MSDAEAPRWDREAFRAGLDAAIGAFVDEQAEALLPLGQDAARLVAEARAVVVGGKRFRASFCWWGHSAVGGGASPDEATREGLLRACAALELLHASALVHDDLMDASDTRRGRPTVHRVFEREHASVHGTTGMSGATGMAGATAYGAAAAVLLGDLLLGWSDELLRRCGLPADRVAAAMDVLAATRTEVIAGQFLDISVQARGRADVDAAMRVLRYKSARYSVERPLLLGATLAGADAAQLAALSGFGLPLGEAFQLRDDLLGVYGDPATTGKPAGDDLVEGKRTVLVALALDAAPAADAAFLDRALGTPTAAAEVGRLRAIVESSGARAQVESVIAHLTEVALAALDRAEIDDGARAALRELAGAVTRRTA